MPPELTIQIVGWNSAAALPRLLDCLRTIPVGEVVIRYIDNASSDTSVDLVRSALPDADIIQMPSNTGFAGGHNEGFRRCTTPFVLVLNPDVVLEREAVSELLGEFKDNRVAAVQGKVLRLPRDHSSAPVIDSAGIILSKALNGIERGAGEEDRGQFDTKVEVVGVTGACGIYRLDALRRVAHLEHEVFDEDFFAYKEDVDLGWRLNRANWKVLYMPRVAGHHTRQLKGQGKTGWSLAPRALFDRLRSPLTHYSFRNWVWMVVKNVTLKQEVKHELFIDARLAVMFLLSLLYPPLLTVWVEVIRGLPRMTEKRVAIAHATRAV